VFLWRIFLVKPFAALSIIICLVTIYSCVATERKRPTQKSDRFLIAVLGFLAVYQAMRIMQGVGLVGFRMGPTLDDAIELVITAFYLMAALMLRLSSRSRLDAESAMRLAQAAPPLLSLRPEPVTQDAATIETLHWALSRLSDPAFKLYTLLALRADYATGRVPMSPQDLRLQSGKTKEELDACLTELEKSGAVNVQMENGNPVIELLAHGRRNPSIEEPVHA
jgi:hypothetical protein